MKRGSECHCCPQRVRRPDAHLRHHQGATFSSALPTLRKQSSVLTLLIALMMFFRERAESSGDSGSTEHPAPSKQPIICD